MIKHLLGIFGFGLARLHAQDDLFLQAVSAIESGDNDRAVSRSGARGRYQIMPATWAQHTTDDFSLAHDPGYAKEVALKHIAWLRMELTKQLKEEGEIYEAQYWQIARAWKSGVNYRKRQNLPQDVDYANRLISVFNDLKYRQNQ